MSGSTNGFYDHYEEEIRRRTNSGEEREALIRKVNAMREKATREMSREAAQYGVKEIVWAQDSTVEGVTEDIAEYFGLNSAE